MPNTNTTVLTANNSNGSTSRLTSRAIKNFFSKMLGYYVCSYYFCGANTYYTMAFNINLALSPVYYSRCYDMCSQNFGGNALFLYNNQI